MWTFFAGCCLLLCVQAVPAPGHGALKGYCITNSDCSESECCVSFIQRRGKRRAERSLSDDLKRFVSGKCERLGTSGSKCFVRDLPLLVTDIYDDACPCQTSYNCEGTGQLVVPQGEIGICAMEYSPSG